MISTAENQRAEGQLRRLIGDGAYTRWEETGEIDVGGLGTGVGHWSIRKGRSGPISLYYGKTWHCVGAAYGFKGAIPLADQVIALCLWIHADEGAVSDRKFPRVQSMPRAQRAQHWDAIVSGAPVELPAKRPSRWMDEALISRLAKEHEGETHTAKEWLRLLGLSPTTGIWDTAFAGAHLICVGRGPPALSKCVPKKEGRGRYGTRT